MQLQRERQKGKGQEGAAMDGGGGGKTGCTTRSRRGRTTGRVPTYTGVLGPTGPSASASGSASSSGVVVFLAVSPACTGPP